MVRNFGEFSSLDAHGRVQNNFIYMYKYTQGYEYNTQGHPNLDKEGEYQ